MESKVRNVHEDMKTLKADQEQFQIRNWLKPADPRANLQKGLQQRLQGSGEWFLSGEEFSRWIKERNSFLWIYGIPGCGKTILSSTVLEHLHTGQETKPVIYFYFDFSDTNKQTLENMIWSLISQLCHEREETRVYLTSFWESHEK